MRERGAFLRGYLLGSQTDTRELARRCARIEGEGKSLDTWRRSITKWKGLDNEPSDQAISVLALALGVDAAEFPPVMAQDVQRRLGRPVRRGCGAVRFRDARYAVAVALRAFSASDRGVRV